jgi:CRISPR-associated protein Cas1
MFSAVSQAGLDSYLGILHEDKYGRPSIALDMIEEYRPVIVDLIVILMVNKRMLNLDDFYIHDDGAVLIGNQARKKFIEQYEKRMNTKVQYQQGERTEQLTYRRTMVKQAYRLIRTLKGEDVYQCVEIK